MGLFFRYFNWYLFSFALFSLIALFIFDFYLFNIEESFKGAHIIGKIIYNLLLSYTAGYIFYLMTVYYSEYKTKKAIRTSLSYDINQVLSSYRTLIRTICKSSNQEITGFFMLEEIENACNFIALNRPPINPNENNTVRLTANWPPYLNVHMSVVKEGIHSIFSLYINNLDEELKTVLSKIKVCDYFEIINSLDQYKVQNTLLSTYSDKMNEYIGLMDSLNNYLEKKL